ncbi:hypothetical protein [Methanobrevibacter sp.]
MMQSSALSKKNLKYKDYYLFDSTVLLFKENSINIERELKPLTQRLWDASFLLQQLRQSYTRF